MPGFALHWLTARLGDLEQANPKTDVELPLARSFAAALELLVDQGSEPAVALVVVVLPVPELLELDARQPERQCDDSQVPGAAREIASERLRHGHDQIRLRD